MWTAKAISEVEALSVEENSCYKCDLKLCPLESGIVMEIRDCMLEIDPIEFTLHDLMVMMDTLVVEYESGRLWLNLSEPKMETTLYEH